MGEWCELYPIFFGIFGIFLTLQSPLGRQCTHLCVDGISLIMGVLGRDVDDVRQDEMSRAPWINSTVDSSWAHTLLSTVLVPFVWFYKTHNGHSTCMNLPNGSQVINMAPILPKNFTKLISKGGRMKARTIIGYRWQLLILFEIQRFKLSGLCFYMAFSPPRLKCL